MTSLTATILTSTIHALRQRLHASRHQSQQSQFLWWGLDDTTPEHETFAQITGLTQLAHLSGALLKGLIEEEHHAAIGPYCGALNAYFFFEITSDNLAQNLGPLAGRDSTANLRRGLLTAFNQAMIARLRGDQHTAADLMQRIKPLCATVSSLDHNLNADKRNALLQIYAVSAGVPLEAVEYDLWILLQENIESCARLLHNLRESPLRDSVRQNLIHRYEALNALMLNDSNSREVLLDHSTWTILVAPTMLYFIAALHRVTPLPKQLTPALEDGLLNEAAYSTALVVRLLNDLGLLMTMPENEFRSQMEFLHLCHQGNPGAYATLDDAISAVTPYTPAFTRLHKDLHHGEHNVSFHRLAPALTSETLHQLEVNLHHYRRVYQQQTAHLEALLNRLTESLGDARPSQMMQRMVVFHERMYAAPFTESAGEFAM